MLALSHPANPEHPPLGKELLALGIALFGDRALGWRVMPLLSARSGCSGDARDVGF